MFSGDEVMAAILRGWSHDARLGSRLTAPDGVVLVLDAAANRVLHASAAAAGLRLGIAGRDGRVIGALRLDQQIRPALLVEGRPSLARIRFDARRLGLPSTCIVVRTRAAPGNPPVLLVALTEPAPLLRPAPDASEPALAADTGPAVPPEAPADDPSVVASGSPRFTWRSDDRGVLTQVTGPAADAVRGMMVGRSWQALSQAGILDDAEGLLAALAAHRTFRSIPLTLREGRTYDLDVSGAPLARSGRDFQGFGGFGLLRPSARDAGPMPAPLEAVGSAGPAHDAPAASEKADPPLSTNPHLSTNEHAAFREIARALGARFAGDDEAPETTPAERTPEVRLPNCSVMPFPVQAPRPAEGGVPDPDAAVAGTLERLPTGVLVYRGDAVLFANRALLDLAGFPALAAMEEAGGVARLFGGLAPHERAASEGPAILATRTGGALGVDLERSTLDWQGTPAELILVRDAALGEAEVDHQPARQIDWKPGDLAAADAVAILDTIEDGIAILDDRARILGLNRSAASLFGLAPREVVGASFMSLFAPESAVDILAGLHGVPGPAGEVPAVAIDVKGLGRDGVVPMQVGFTPLRTGHASSPSAALPVAGAWPPPPSDTRQGGLVSVVIRHGRAARSGQATQARHAAEAASARKSDFLARISHEIRTPINGILGFADLMLGEPLGPLGNPRYREYLGDIHASGTHVLSLVNDLLDLAKIEAGGLALTFTEVPLNAIVSGCVSMMQPRAARDRIVVRTSFSADLSTLLADERSLRQAALNVIANAINFTEAGGQVIVSTAMADRGEIALRVRDTGIGMTPEEIEIALEPFRQVSVARARPGSGKETGTGLGLPLTKALVEANHGRFRITSRKDEGTLVEMLFPVRPATMSA